MKIDEDVKIDDRHRAALGERVKPKERYAIETPSPGVIVLRRMVVKQEPLPKVKRERRAGRTLLVSDRTVSNADTQRVMEAFP